MHTGEDAEFYLKKGFKVIGVEANPVLVEQVKKKFIKEIVDEDLVVIDKAIAPEDVSEIDFFINDDKNDWGTIIPEWNRNMSSNFNAITVKTIQLEKLIDAYGVPYYMKIDIEGADVLCLKSLSKINVIPDYISVELLSPNNLGKDGVDCLEIISHLCCMGYKKFKISDQSKNIDIKCPNPPLEGNFVDFCFGGESSGLFGKELDSKDLSLDEVSGMYLDYFYNSEKRLSFANLLKKIGIKKREQIFHRSGWFDIHAYK